MNDESVELYYANESANGCQLHPDVYDPDHDWSDDVEYWGEYPTLEAAIAAAEAEGLGLWFTSGPREAHYTGRILVAHQAEPEYSPI